MVNIRLYFYASHNTETIPSGFISPRYANNELSPFCFTRLNHPEMGWQLKFSPFLIKYASQ